MHHKLDQPDPFDDAKFPQAQPLEKREERGFLTFSKGGKTIFRVNIEDAESLFVAHSLVSGIAKCAMVPAELDNLRDILEGVIRAREGGS
jgi:hypothetical protein